MYLDVVLRPVEMEDLDEEYFAWYDNADGHLNYFTGSNRKFTREVIIEDFKLGLSSERWFYFLITTNLGVKIGTVKIGPIDKKNKTSDLVCLIGNRKFLGKSLGTLAISKAIEIAFKQFDIRRLQSGMIADNTSSIKSYVKAGWYVEGIMKGYYWIDGKNVDRVSVACLNPKYFDDEVH
ncbi:MAG: GNAT family protein [Pseudohongiellaceae bacterium]|nr:GNAT family protein [Pseudohongiellaceae bacterium]